MGVRGSGFRALRCCQTTASRAGPLEPGAAVAAAEVDIDGADVAAALTFGLDDEEARAAAPASGLRAPPQLVLLGMGEPWMERALQGLAASFPGRAAGIAAFSEEARPRRACRGGKAPPHWRGGPWQACQAGHWCRRSDRNGKFQHAL